MLGKSTDGVISRTINRRISSRISKWIVDKGVPITPNQATLSVFLISLTPLPLYILGYNIIAGVLVQIASIADGIDGEIARLKGLTSRFGAFIDAVLDRIADLAIIVGATLYVLKFQHSGFQPVMYSVIPILALSGSFLVSYIHERAEKDLGRHPAYFGRLPPIASRDTRLFIIFIGSIVGFVFESLILVVALSFFYVTFKLAEIWRSQRQG